MKETGGCYFEPTIFKNVKNNMKIAQEEIFGLFLQLLLLQILMRLFLLLMILNMDLQQVFGLKILIRQ